MPRPRHSRLEAHPIRSRRALLRWLVPLVFAWGLGNLAALSGEAEPLPSEQPATAVFPISRLELVHAEPHPDRPALDDLVPVTVELRETDLGWAAPRAGEPTQRLEIGGPRSPTVRLEASGLAVTLRALVSKIREKGLLGVDLRPSSRDIDLETERDLRPADRDALEIVVHLGRIGLLRTVAVGDRIREDSKIDHELHEPIRLQSPLQPAGSADEDSTDLLDRRALEDYLHRLNRYPGRRVEAALSPAIEPGEVVLDYRVFESRPWFVYGQVSDTGTDRTSRWQTRAGFVHRQLTNRDDTLSLEYLNGGKNVHGIRAQYQAPFFGSSRPDWMNRRKGDPGWIRWLPREKIPWWGVDRLRWEADLSYGTFEADRSSVSIFREDLVVSEQLQVGGRLIYEAWQYRDFFVDVSAGLRFRNLRVENKLAPAPATGKDLFVLTRLAAHAERINAISNLAVDLGAEGQIRDTDGDERQQLGRADVDGRYVAVDFNVGYSTYLEPVLFPAAFRDPESKRSSTLAHEIGVGARGQYAFNYRLIPQASQVIGGLYSVRGFRQSQAVGDSVFIGSLEYRFHVPRALPIMRQPLRLPLLGDFRVTPQQIYGRPDWDLTLRAFVDVGRAIRNANNASSSSFSTSPNPLFTGDFEDDETLVGVGVGAELQFRSNLRARIDWATPLTSTATDTDTVEFGDKSEIHLLFSILY